jgi:Na+-driven multidrug efflux pump
MRGAGRAMVPMLVMLATWCLLRVTYITIAVRFVNELETVSRAYPITWACSSIIYVIYFFTADWIHGFEKDEKTSRI